MSIISRMERKRRVGRVLEPLISDRQLPKPLESEWVHVGFESGDWLQHVSAASEDAASSTQDLLRRSALELSGNLRYAWDGARVLLIGEVPIPKEADEPLAEAGNRLQRLLANRLSVASNRAAASDPNEELLATLLAECGYVFQPRDHGWVLPAHAGLSEVKILAGKGGAWVEMVLSNAERIEDTSQQALALYLCRAHRWLRFVRLELNETDVRVTSFAETPWLETDLVVSVHAVVSAGALIRREVNALRSPDLARAYLDEYGGKTEYPK